MRPGEQFDQVRLRQAEELLAAGLLMAPDWMPLIVDPRVAPIPIVAIAEHESDAYICIGWHAKEGTMSRSRLWTIATRRNGALTINEGYTSHQIELVLDMIAELRPIASRGQLEGRY